jgi:hypothetical protein
MEEFLAILARSSESSGFSIEKVIDATRDGYYCAVQDKPEADM